MARGGGCRSPSPDPATGPYGGNVSGSTHPSHCGHGNRRRSISPGRQRWDHAARRNERLLRQRAGRDLHPRRHALTPLRPVAAVGVSPDMNGRTPHLVGRAIRLRHSWARRARHLPRWRSRHTLLAHPNRYLGNIRQCAATAGERTASSHRRSSGTRRCRSRRCQSRHRASAPPNTCRSSPFYTD